MKQAFVEKSFSRSSLEVIEWANAIIAEYDALGYSLSLRQLYYQLVARDYVENTVQSYKRVGTIVSDARNAGLIDWNAIEDRGRTPYLPPQWTSPAQIVRAAAQQFRVDRWEGQDNYVELMVEKDALSGILRPVCSTYHVRFSANKGYSSSTAMYDAGQRFLEAYNAGKTLNLIYLGDHDPSGIDMTRDIQERLNLYGENLYLEVNRIALNMPQVEKWNPPPNPAKETDSRFTGYEAEYGSTSWELDAIEPRTLAELVEGEIESLIDLEQWQVIQEKEQAMKDELTKFADAYDRRAKKKGSK
ncbi:MAG TPA: hypothetical protein VIY48_19485 [Candidatus Paceibacterota bacterium]